MFSVRICRQSKASSVKIQSIDKRQQTMVDEAYKRFYIEYWKNYKLRVQNIYN